MNLESEYLGVFLVFFSREYPGLYQALFSRDGIKERRVKCTFSIIGAKGAMHAMEFPQAHQFNEEVRTRAVKPNRWPYDSFASLLSLAIFAFLQSFPEIG